MNPGDTVEATVLSVDLEKRRIGLSLDAARQAEATAEADAYASYQNTSETKEKSIGTFGELLQESMGKKKPKS